MRRFRLTERKIALICAAVLITLSVTAVFRQHNFSMPSASNQNQKMTPSANSDSSNIDSAPDEPVAPLANEQDKPSTAKSDDTKKTNSTPDESKQDAAKSQSFNFTAVSGSTFTDFARKSITDYAQKQKIMLTSDQLLDAEVTLTNNAGSPLLEIGQVVTIDQSSIVASLQAAQVETAVTPSTAPKAAEAPIANTQSQDCSFVVVADDSYSTLARSCLATYYKSKTISLSKAQQAAAESFVTRSADDSPFLEIGQTVTISSSDIQKAVEYAKQLDTQQLLMWQSYADTIAW